MSTIYRRDQSNWIGSNGNPRDVSLNYWRKQASDMFHLHPHIEVVEVVKSGRVADSALLERRNGGHAPDNAAVIVASTGGRWGKSRRDFHPRPPSGLVQKQAIESAILKTEHTV
jgi:hypothetical protein